MSESQALLIYDGDCAFCTRCVTWGVRNLSAFPNPLPFQKVDPATFGLSALDVRKAVWVIAPNQILSGARAVAWILKGQAKFRWRLIGRFIDWCPVRPFASLGYRLVAINRHRFPGATTECKMVNLD